MTEEDYIKLKDRMPEIANSLSDLPESLQEKAFDTMVAALLGNRNSLQKVEPPPSKDPKISPCFAEIDPRIASRSQDGKYILSIRDLKAKTAIDAAIRLTYVIIRSYTKVIGTESVSRKEIITPYLRQWRLDNGNTRGLIANDIGILKNGDSYSLDLHAQSDADAFIEEILNQEISGSWKPGMKKRKRKSTSKEEDINGNE